MKKFLKKHRVRAAFYNLVAMVFLFSTALWGMGIISDAWSFYISAFLFIVDYLAEMYDTHPDNPGPWREESPLSWIKRHFHRITDDDDYGEDV